MSETKSEFGFQIDEPVKTEAKPPKRKPKQKAVIEEPVNVKEEAEKLLIDEAVQEVLDEAVEKPVAEAPKPPKPPVAKEEPKPTPKPAPKPAPELKAPPVRPEPVLYGMKKVKRRMKVRRNLA